VISTTAEHFYAALAQARIESYPYEHVYVHEPFPRDYYLDICNNLPEDDSYTDRTFENRMMCTVTNLKSLFWSNLVSWMATKEMLFALYEKFYATLKTRREKSLGLDLRLVRDRTGYQIKPHTDIKAKAISLLFYLPEGEDMKDAGTSVFVPKQEGFTSDGTRRYEFADFEKLKTAAFLPNTMFGFPRSDISFHGVEPVSAGRRDVLLLNVYAQT
jgi:hypothetical protein